MSMQSPDPAIQKSPNKWLCWLRGRLGTLQYDGWGSATRCRLTQGHGRPREGRAGLAEATPRWDSTGARGPGATHRPAARREAGLTL